MATKTENALEALKAVIMGLGSVNVRRNPLLPTAFEAGQLVAILDGTPEETGRRFAVQPVIEFEHAVILEIVVTGKNDESRNSKINALVSAIGTALSADLKLGGAVDYLTFGPPADPATDLFVGAEDVQSCSIEITLFYETSENPMEAV